MGSAITALFQCVQNCSVSKENMTTLIMDPDPAGTR